MNIRDFTRLFGLTLLGNSSSGYDWEESEGILPKGKKRIVVVGAGMAGLAAAHTLQSQGHETLVLEARDRIGGRIWTSTKWQDMPLDMGATWIHGVEGNPLTSLANKIKAPRLMTRYENAVTYNTNGKPLSASEENRLDTMRKRIFKALEQAQNQDNDASIRQVIEPLLRGSTATSEERRFANFILSAELEDEYSGSATKISAHWYDDSGAFEGDDALFPHGFDVIPKHLAQGLKIELGQSVREIQWNQSPVRVITKRSEFNADQVLVTLPCGVLQAQKVKFSPELPRNKREAIAKLGMGVLNKCYLRFQNAFWHRDADWLEYIPSTHGMWTEWVSFWNAAKMPILLGFNSADVGIKMEEWSDRAIVASAMQTLKTIYGHNIPEPIDYQITRWAKDPFALGSYSYNAVGSTPTMRKTLSAPLENKLLFAGEATHKEYYGTTHGAYLSGLRAAKEILAT